MFETVLSEPVFGPFPIFCQSLQKWLVFLTLLGPGSKGLPRVLCTTPTLFAPVQPHVAPVQEASCSRCPKDLLHPLLTIFGELSLFGPNIATPPIALYSIGYSYTYRIYVFQGIAGYRSHTLQTHKRPSLALSELFARPASPGPRLASPGSSRGLILIGSFKKGLADRGGWRKEISPTPQIQAFFLPPFFYAPL